MLPSHLYCKRVFKCKCGVTKPFSKEKSQFYKVNVKIKHPTEEEIQSTTAIRVWKEKHFKSGVADFECPSCNHDKALIETRQMRSAHKGMTHYLVCLNCNKQIIIES